MENQNQFEQYFQSTKIKLFQEISEKSLKNEDDLNKSENDIVDSKNIISLLQKYEKEMNESKINANILQNDSKKLCENNANRFFFLHQRTNKMNFRNSNIKKPFDKKICAEKKYRLNIQKFNDVLINPRKFMFRTTLIFKNQGISHEKIEEARRRGYIIEDFPNFWRIMAGVFVQNTIQKIQSEIYYQEEDCWWF